MKVRIYQIIPELDEDHLMFRDLQFILVASNKRIPAELYECVYEGEFETEHLERLFIILNSNLPRDYCARSLSVSDVVEVIHSPEKSSFYFCDSFGFQLFPFDKEKAMLPIQNHDYEPLLEIRQNVTAYFMSEAGLTRCFSAKFILNRCKYSDSQLGYRVRSWYDLDINKPLTYNFLERPRILLAPNYYAVPESLLYIVDERGRRMRFGAHSPDNLTAIKEWCYEQHVQIEIL